MRIPHQAGSLRKTTKSVILAITEKEVNVVSQLPASFRQTVYILDSMAMVQNQLRGPAEQASLVISR